MTMSPAPGRSPGRARRPGPRSGPTTAVRSSAAGVTATPWTVICGAGGPNARPADPACVPPVADGTTTSSKAQTPRDTVRDELEPGQDLADGADRRRHRPSPITNGRRPAVRRSATTRSRRAVRSARSAVMRLVDRRAEQLVEEHARVGRIGSAGRTGRDGRPARRARRRRRSAGQWFDQRRPVVIRRVRAVGQRRTDEELEIPQLVAAERERQQVLALDPDLGPAAERGRQARQRRERRRSVEQTRSAGSGPRSASSGARGRWYPLVSSAHGRPRHPGRPPHHGRPASRHGALDRDLAPDGRLRRGSIRRSSRPRPATGPGSTTTATAKPRSTSCPARRPTRSDRPGSRTRFDATPATSSTSRPARSTSRPTRRRPSRSSSS